MESHNYCENYKYKSSVCKKSHNSSSIEYSRKDEKLIFDLKQRIPQIDELFHIYRRIGEGTFSTVFLATLKNDHFIPMESRKHYAIKLLIPTTHPDRIKRELECLLNFGGTDNVVGVELCLRNNESVAFIMPFIAHDKFHDYYDRMDVDEIRYYLKNLLTALKHVHSFNIIHRDIKPSNFLYDRQNKHFLLVDFGLAQRSKSSENLKIKIKNDDENQNRKSMANNSGNASLSHPTKHGLRPSTTKSLLNHNLEKNADANHKNESFSPVVVMERLSQYNNNNNNNTNNNNKSLNSSLRTYNLTRSKQRIPPIDSICNCYGKPMVCNICIVQKEICASRAGTPGYRPPEVLIKYPYQTTAVDIWAVGIIFLSILSGCYPFFKANDDITTLAEMITVFGDRAVIQTAHDLGRNLTICHKKRPLNIRKLCMISRKRLSNENNPKKNETTNTIDIASGKTTNKKQKSIECDYCKQILDNCLCLNPDENDPEQLDYSNDIYPDSAYNLLLNLLTINPHDRITAEQALNHEFFNA